MIDRETWMGASASMRLLAEGRQYLSPHLVADVNRLLDQFWEDARPFLQDMLRNDLQRTPPDDRDAKWQEYWQAATEE